MTDNLADIKRKITALLAKAEGTDNEFEANTFMAKVNELMERYQIQRHELGSDDDKMGHQKGETNMYASMSWAKLLADAVAKYYGARCIFTKVKNHIQYTLLGRESARITTELMLPFIISQVRQQAKIYARENGKTDSVAQKEIGQALCVRLWKLIRSTETARAEHASKMLVPVNEIDSYIATVYAAGHLKTTKGRSIKMSGAASDAAARIAINHQAPNAKGTKVLA